MAIEAKLTAINITLDYILLALKNTNYILLGMLILFVFHEVFKVYTYFKKK